jgi:BMFP domain-containing protein YqiC
MTQEELQALRRVVEGAVERALAPASEQLAKVLEHLENRERIAALEARVAELEARLMGDSGPAFTRATYAGSRLAQSF